MFDHFRSTIIYLIVNASLFMLKPMIPFGLKATISDRPLSTLIKISVYLFLRGIEVIRVYEITNSGHHQYIAMHRVVR